MDFREEYGFCVFTSSTKPLTKKNIYHTKPHASGEIILISHTNKIPQYKDKYCEIITKPKNGRI